MATATATKSRKRSELWERLRAVRMYANKTQKDVAKELDVSRAAVALWESPTEGIRTSPSAQQIMAYAKVCNVPAQFLIDDTQRADDVYAYMQELQGITKSPKGEEELVRRAAAFWSAVHFETLVTHPKASAHFNVSAKLGGIEFTAALLKGQDVASFSYVGADWQAQVLREASNLMFLERAMGHALNKHLLMFWPAPSEDAPQLMAFARALDIRLTLVSDVPKTAKYLGNLLN